MNMLLSHTAKAKDDQKHLTKGKSEVGEQLFPPRPTYQVSCLHSSHFRMPPPREGWVSLNGAVLARKPFNDRGLISCKGNIILEYLGKSLVGVGGRLVEYMRGRRKICSHKTQQYPT